MHELVERLAFSRDGLRRGRWLALVWVSLAILGALDEWHQLWIPSRDAELGDWVMDAAGSACGLIVGTLLARLRWAARLLR